MRKLLALTFIAMIFASTAAAMPIQTNVQDSGGTGTTSSVCMGGQWYTWVYPNHYYGPHGPC